MWRPPPHPFFKMNFDAAIFNERGRSGFGPVIRNEHREVMAALSDIGPSVSGSEEVETLACRKAVEFAVDAGFSELIIGGDSINVMKALFLQVRICQLFGMWLLIFNGSYMS